MGSRFAARSLSPLALLRGVAVPTLPGRVRFLVAIPIGPAAPHLLVQEGAVSDLLQPLIAAGSGCFSPVSYAVAVSMDFVAQSAVPVLCELAIPKDPAAQSAVPGSCAVAIPSGLAAQSAVPRRCAVAIPTALLRKVRCAFAQSVGGCNPLFGPLSELGQSCFRTVGGASTVSTGGSCCRPAHRPMAAALARFVGALVY